MDPLKYYLTLLAAEELRRNPQDPNKPLRIPENPTALTAHRHKCANPSCNFVWEHLPDLLGEDEDAFDRSHSCPKCGTMQVRVDNTHAPCNCRNDGNRIVMYS